MSALDDTLKRHRQRVIAREEQTFRELLQAYGVIERELRDSLRELEQKIKDAQAAGQTISPSWFSRERRLTALLDQVKSQIERFGGTAANITAREQRAAITIAADAMRETVEAIAPGTLPPGSIFNPLVVEDAVGMMGDGSPIHSYYTQNLAPKVAEAIRVEVIKAAAAGTDFKTVARRLLQTGQITKQRALTVARTEVGRVRRETTRRIYAENGITEWEWVASKSPRTCVVCLAMDGRRFPIDTPFPQHINCRCTMIPVIPGVTMPPRTLGKDWFDKQPDDVKEKIIGKDGLAAYKAGLITLDDFEGRRNHPLFGESVYTKPLSTILAGKPIADKVIQTPANISINFQPGTEIAIEDLLGLSLSHDEIGGLVGALDGSTITVSDWGDGIIFDIRHPLVAKQRRILDSDWRGRLYIHNDHFRTTGTAPKGTGLKSFATEVFHAQKFGVEYIDTYAAGNYQLSQRSGSDHWIGYYVWPRFGYNAALDQADWAKFPPTFRGIPDLNELFDQPNGWFVWKYHGTAREMLFDLDPASRSTAMLKGYLQTRGFKLRLP